MKIQMYISLPKTILMSAAFELHNIKIASWVLCDDKGHLPIKNLNNEITKHSH